MRLQKHSEPQTRSQTITVFLRQLAEYLQYSSDRQLQVANGYIRVEVIQGKGLNSFTCICVFFFHPHMHNRQQPPHTKATKTLKSCTQRELQPPPLT